MGNPVRKKMVVCEHDGLITISTGGSRRTKVWKKKTVRWSQLVARLSETTRTQETQAQFFKMPKTRQDEVKDIGGFVGGEMEGGRRTAMCMRDRQIVTLDADFADADLWGMVPMLYGENAICVYSTHKHTKEKPRLRLVIPLTRAVSPDEYQAVSRKVAEMFGIDIFDDTTYQPHRLMYWPSTSADAPYEFHFQDGPWLDADAVLAEYDDWQDQTTWPVSARQGEIVQHAMKKQEDPLEKDGLIGAFCRCYTIQEVISGYLPDVYEPCAGHEDRYTYKAGTSVGGAVVYDDKFLYSHHATDPATCKLLNAFDLVRIHKFGELDEGKTTENVKNLPSWQKMMDLVAADEKVKVLKMKERMQEASDDFEGIDVLEADTSLEWTGKLKMDKNGNPFVTRANIRIILNNDLRVKDTFGWDGFAQRIAILKPPAWRTDADIEKFWADSDDSELRYLMETIYGIESKQKIEDEVLNCAMRHMFHEVREYLSGLKWDGKKRMDTLFIDCLGAEDTPFSRAATRKMLIAGVGRVMSPGLKFDNMVVLEGPQGIGKSYLLKKLGKKWFSDTLDSIGSKESYEQLRGVWVIEVGELSAMKNKDVEPVKQFISKQADIYRVAYGKRTTEFPRQCIFIGTTNESTFLRDQTGNRRFWPIRCAVTKPTRLPWDEDFDAYIDQVWAEAKAAFESHEDVWIGREMEQAAAEVQKVHTEETPLLGMLEEYLKIPIPKSWYTRDPSFRRDYIKSGGDEFVLDDSDKETRLRTRISPTEVWVEMLGGDIKHFDNYHRKEIRAALRQLKGWHLYKDNYTKLSFGKGYGQQMSFVRDGCKDDEKHVEHGKRNDLG